MNKYFLKLVDINNEPLIIDIYLIESIRKSEGSTNSSTMIVSTTGRYYYVKNTVDEFYEYFKNNLTHGEI
jgi:uncharacterized protein YlzI (FlbEa/FlbD family)